MATNKRTSQGRISTNGHPQEAGPGPCVRAHRTPPTRHRHPPTVFINYRVQEQPGYATLLYHELSHRFGAGFVFFAPNSIAAGDDFIDAVFDNLRQCSVMLAVIGSGWLSCADPTGGREAFNGDWVLAEIAAAFTLGIRVIPVLIEDAKLPVESALPLAIAPLSRCQYLRLRHYSVSSDLKAVIRELKQLRTGRSSPAGDQVPQ